MKSVVCAALTAFSVCAASADVLRPDPAVLYKCNIEFNGQPIMSAEYTLRLSRARATLTADERVIFDGQGNKPDGRAHQIIAYYNQPGVAGSETLVLEDSLFRARRGKVFHNFKIGGQPTFRVYRCVAFGAEG
ncbi:MAG TPA: hypothetical protein VFV50_19125 [Bdellovibrionales bacterium]|nr:hypothetical protein [Bdellovibrionales bacterium]